ncbi:hypothetical protein ACFPM0_14200 [Pseudonocardia sulfidoxydans]|uniref:hypothetical protein n=1 Tax=Pseudonocardia sulfidoxydans TaxID=54011 RepID=UPI003607CBC0
MSGDSRDSDYRHSQQLSGMPRRDESGGTPTAAWRRRTRGLSGGPDGCPSPVFVTVAQATGQVREI